jgi:hypothetical protein
MRETHTGYYDNVSLIISCYEIGMSKTIMNTGFQIYATLSDTTFDKVSRQKRKGGDDIWLFMDTCCRGKKCSFSKHPGTCLLISSNKLATRGEQIGNGSESTL